MAEDWFAQNAPDKAPAQPGGGADWFAQNAPQSKDSGVTGFVKNWWDQVNPVAAGNAMIDTVKHPIDTLQHMGQSMAQPAVAAQDSFAHGRYLEGVRHGINYMLNVVPGVGSSLDAAGSQGDQGDISGMLGTTAGVATNLRIPKIASGLARGVQGATEGAQSMIGMNRDPHVSMTQALKPTGTNVQFPDALRRAMPEIKASEVALGRPTENLDQLLENIKHAKDRVWNQYSNIAGPQAQRGISLGNVADAMEGSIPAKLRLENPRMADAIAQRAALYRSRPFTIQEAEDLLKTTNAELNSYYAKYPAARQVSATSNPDTAALAAQGDAIRKSLYGNLDQEGEGMAPTELKRRYGALMNLEDVANRRVNVAARQSPDSLSEQVGKWHAAGQVGRGLIRGVSGDLGGAAMDIGKGVAERSVAKALKEANTSDALVKSALKSYKGAPGEIPYEGVAPRALLGRPDIVTPPPADTSSVTGGPRTINVYGPKPKLLGQPDIVVPPPQDTSGMTVKTGAPLIPKPGRQITAGDIQVPPAETSGVRGVKAKTVTYQTPDGRWVRQVLSSPAENPGVPNSFEMPPQGKGAVVEMAKGGVVEGPGPIEHGPGEAHKGSAEAIGQYIRHHGGVHSIVSPSAQDAHQIARSVRRHNRNAPITISDDGFDMEKAKAEQQKHFNKRKLYVVAHLPFEGKPGTLYRYAARKGGKWAANPMDIGNKDNLHLQAGIYFISTGQSADGPGPMRAVASS